jgi:hypothetical protein
MEVAAMSSYKVSSLLIGIGVAIIVSFGIIGFTSDTYVSNIPWGSVFSCQTCHTAEPDLNVFGFAYSNNGNLWDATLAALDSDGDGYTNGTELQDPSGLWIVGEPDPGDGAFVSNPGDDASTPPPTPTPAATPTFTPVPTATPAATETPTPTPTPSETPTPSPTPYGWTFDTGSAGWTVVTSPPFTPAIGSANTGMLYLKATDSFTFGYWNSPALPVTPGRIYRARFTVTTDVSPQSKVPQFRMRVNSGNNQIAGALTITSVSQGESSPAAFQLKTYDLYFDSPVAEPLGAVVFAFDLLNFDPEDALNGAVMLDQVEVQNQSASVFP